MKSRRILAAWRRVTWTLRYFGPTRVDWATQWAQRLSAERLAELCRDGRVDARGLS